MWIVQAQMLWPSHGRTCLSAWLCLVPTDKACGCLQTRHYERGGQILPFDGSPMRLPVQWGPVAKWLKRGNEDHHERIKEVLLLRRPRALSSWPVAKSPGAAQQSGPMAFPVELPQKLVTASAGELALSFSMSEAVTKPRSIKP